jgi:hypothetical protein
MEKVRIAALIQASMAASLIAKPLRVSNSIYFTRRIGGSS